MHGVRIMRQIFVSDHLLQGDLGITRSLAALVDLGLNPFKPYSFVRCDRRGGWIFTQDSAYEPKDSPPAGESA